MAVNDAPRPAHVTPSVTSAAEPLTIRFRPIADTNPRLHFVGMNNDASYGIYCMLLGGAILAWGFYAKRLPVPFIRLSGFEERVWYWVNMSGAGLAFLIGLWVIVT